MNCAYNSSISINQYLPGKKKAKKTPGTQLTQYHPIAQPVPWETPWGAGFSAFCHTAANGKVLKGWGLPQSISSTLETPFTHIHKPHNDSQIPNLRGRCELPRLCSHTNSEASLRFSRGMQKWEYFFLVGDTSTNPSALAEAFTKSWRWSPELLNLGSHH